MARLTMVDLLARIEELEANVTELETEVKELKAQAPQQQLSPAEACALHASLLNTRRAAMDAAKAEAMRTGKCVKVTW